MEHVYHALQHNSIGLLNLGGGTGDRLFDSWRKEQTCIIGLCSVLT